MLVLMLLDMYYADTVIHILINKIWRKWALLGRVSIATAYGYLRPGFISAT